MALTLAEHLAAARAARTKPLTSDEAREIVRLPNLRRTLARLRPVRWPDSEPLSGPEVAFVLSLHPNSLPRLLDSGRLRYEQRGRFYFVRRADLRDYLDALFAEARSLGVSIPAAALQVLAPAAKAPAARGRTRSHR